MSALELLQQVAHAIKLTSPDTRVYIDVRGAQIQISGLVLRDGVLVVKAGLEE